MMHYTKSSQWARPLILGLDSGPKRSKTDHSSPAEEVSMGPSALDRRTGATRSSVRSHRIVGLQPSVPRRHHWPTGGFVLKPRTLSEASVTAFPRTG